MPEIITAPPVTLRLDGSWLDGQIPGQVIGYRTDGRPIRLPAGGAVALAQGQAAALLKASLGVATLTAFSGTPKIRLGTNAPTSTVAMTELTGSGYTAGGTAGSFSTTSTNTTTGPTSSISWTNSSGSTWSIVGIEIWDQAGTPVRWWFGTWTGQPISIVNGNTFQISAGNITVTI